ncbi:MAG: hypothetical protein EAX91_07325 [Candidatus Lokiarchaeota archaeon]|nr:hypothetical protein [Candidatus Lokiarchaeota archaeon]
MAGTDHKIDARGRIQNFIEQKVRHLLESNMNEYQDPTWVQAAELFNETVVPCEFYFSEGIYKLALEIVKEAERNSCRFAYQKIPGMYNVKFVSGKDKSNNNFNYFDCSRTINSIKKWMKKQEEFTKFKF